MMRALVDDRPHWPDTSVHRKAPKGEPTMPLSTILESAEREFDDEDWDEQDEELGAEDEELDLDGDEEDLDVDDDDI
jgi:hypothetical protein